MRAKKMMLFVVAVGCGLVASIGVSQYMESASSTGEMETVKIFVAINDVSVGEKLSAENVMLEEWPKDRVPEGAIFELEELEDQFSRTRLYSGEPLMFAKMMDSTNSSDATTIPPGFRVIAVPVTLESAVSGLLQPGDRVDLLVFLRRGPEVAESRLYTLLTDINVFSVDGATDRAIDDNGRKRTLKTISLLVTPKQVERVMLAKELGTLSISLRRPDETEKYTSDGETVQRMFGQSSESANEQENQRKKGTELPQWRTAPNPTPGPYVARVPPKWTMRFLSGTGVRVFEWPDEDKLPIEVFAEESGVPPLTLGPMNSTRSAAETEADGGLQDDHSESAEQED